MKNSFTVSFIIVIVFLVGMIYLTGRNTVQVAGLVADTGDSPNSLLGCYGAGSGQNVYTLDIAAMNGNMVSGTLDLNNAEKDSSTGTFNGTYTAGILLADYTFQSEGSTSVMQVIFQRSGNDFVLGYGDMDATGTQFTDLSNITYDATSPLAVFVSEPCPTVQ